jgi:hypothetical protein
MAAYQVIVSGRTTLPDLAGVLVTLRASIAADLGLAQLDLQHYSLKKAAVWQPAEITAAQAAIDGAAAMTPRLVAQRAVDAWPLDVEALALALIDETNRLRAALTVLGAPNLPQVLPAQALAAIRAKASTL